MVDVLIAYNVPFQDETEGLSLIYSHLEVWIELNFFGLLGYQKKKKKQQSTCTTVGRLLDQSPIDMHWKLKSLE